MSEEECGMRTGELPLAISVENVGNGFRVSLAECDKGWERILRSNLYSDLSTARTIAKEWSLQNGLCKVREMGTANIAKQVTRLRDALS